MFTIGHAYGICIKKSNYRETVQKTGGEDSVRPEDVKPALVPGHAHVSSEPFLNQLVLLSFILLFSTYS